MGNIEQNGRRAGGKSEGGGGGEVYVTSHVVPTEHIVQFKGYLSTAEQKAVLDEVLGASSWALVPVSKPFTAAGAKSDFATIKFVTAAAPAAQVATALQPNLLYLISPTRD